MANLRLNCLRADRLALLTTRGIRNHETFRLRALLWRCMPSPTQRKVLRNWVEATVKKRHAAWRHWVDSQLARSGGKLYRWAQRQGADEQGTTLRPTPPGQDQSIDARLEQALAGWTALWQGGQPWTPRYQTKLPPITGPHVRDALRRMKTGKATGADGWRPHELAALPVPWTDQLAVFLNEWEAQGSWPGALRNSLIALVPKAGAQNEGQLRPIGLLSYLYRVWMVVRKQDLKGWSQTIHQGRHQGAAEMAVRTRIQMELQTWEGRHSLLALLDCSKCYERVEHLTAGNRAQDSGCPDTILNLIMDMYSGPRRLRAHGAVSRPTSGHHGLIAGCSFAKDLLKSFLTPIRELDIDATFRDYVDDMTILSHGRTAREAATHLLGALTTVKAHLTSDNMVLNQDKEQIYGSTVEVRSAWRSLSGTDAVSTAKDLGVHHYGYLHKHPVLDSKLSALGPACQRISCIPTTRNRRLHIASSIIFGKCLYGHETHYLTRRHYQQMRGLLARAAGISRGQRNAGLYLLTYRDGRYDPEVVRVVRLATCWIRLLGDIHIPQVYWERCRPGGRLGPIQLLKTTLQAYGILAPTPLRWEVAGRTYNVLDQHGLLKAMGQQIRTVLWGRQAQHKSQLQGLREGRDGAQSVGPTLKDERRQAFRDILLSASVYTPWVSHLRWGKPPHCPACRTAPADWPHFVDSCPRLPRGPDLLPDAPPCLRYTGNVPRDYNPLPWSLQMHTEHPCAPCALESGPTMLVATDGGCHQKDTGDRAGWGVAFLIGPRLSGALAGPAQTAQRGEVTAALVALETASGPIHLLTDSRYVADRLRQLLLGVTVHSLQHGDLWQRILSQRAKLVDVTWVKAHLDWDEANHRGIPYEHWYLNQQADELATQGCLSHQEDPGSLALYRYRRYHIERWQKYLVRVYTLYRALPVFGGVAPAGLQTRLRAEGPRPLARRIRTNRHWQSQHQLRHHFHTAGCERCGRSSCARRQGRLQQWRRPCHILPSHQRRIHRGHRPQWQGQWICIRCPLRGGRLLKQACPRLHPSGGRRATTKRPPWTTLPESFGSIKARIRPLAVAAPMPHGDPDQPQTKRARLAPPGPPVERPQHCVHRSGPFEWCVHCGRTTSARRAGRQQQWRRACIVLPAFAKKIRKGHALHYNGQWHCTRCQCPHDRLTRKRCTLPVALPPAQPLAAPPPVEALIREHAPPPGPAAGPKVRTLLDFWGQPAAKRQCSLDVRSGIG